jgi:hypothetical protein
MPPICTTIHTMGREGGTKTPSRSMIDVHYPDLFINNSNRAKCKLLSSIIFNVGVHTFCSLVFYVMEKKHFYLTPKYMTSIVSVIGGLRNAILKMQQNQELHGEMF